ncbi:hypothetical protein DXG01_000789, partial [Tephrocybe rancida]
TFSRMDHSTDSEKFYGSILATFVDPDEKEEVDPLLEWWNRQIFPGHVSVSRRSINSNSALAHIKERQVWIKAQRMQQEQGQ